MSKLFVFAIGGTGSRVVKSLAMIAAAGVEFGNEIDTLVPIIIDPDAGNGDMDRTLKILDHYNAIRTASSGSEGLFKMQIKTLADLGGGNDQNLSSSYKYTFNQTQKLFRDYIGYHELENTQKKFIDLLFSEKNIKSDMTVGFKGNPNIGSVVLNNFRESAEYATFLNHFNEGDSIFIISSIFGGTGAAGFPLVLKNIRDIDTGRQNAELAGNAKIGALSFLPYFKIKTEYGNEQDIQSATFLSKTKAALHYYDNAIFQLNKLNAFYYLGNLSNGEIPYAEGEQAQKNNAHFLELAGALALVNFSFLIEGPLNETHFSEFGVKNETNNEIRFGNLGVSSEDILKKHLSKLKLLSLFLNHSKEVLFASAGRFFNDAHGIDNQFYGGAFFGNHIEPFFYYFDEWLSELQSETNEPKFKPFHSNQEEHDQLLDFINGIAVPKNIFGGVKKSKISGNRIIENADKLVDEGTFNNNSKEERFIRIMNKVTDDLMNDLI